VPSRYTTRAFVISGTCKREEVIDQQKLLGSACSALVEKSTDIGGRLYCLASDGDSRRRKATIQLTMNRDLDPNSLLYAQLGFLPLFNYHCGADDITMDIDYKHLFKRYRNTLIRLQGTTIGGLVITTQLLKAHLLRGGLTEQRINSLLCPEDRQDVKLMYDLLSAIAVLPEAQPDDTPTFRNTRRVLGQLGTLYRHILEAYTNIYLSLDKQLEHLSAALHLVLAIYGKEKGHFIPSQLYFDFVTAVKNVYFCVAKTQLDDPDGCFWIVLLGSDPLSLGRSEPWSAPIRMQTSFN
jgi:hypothetical protein